MAYLAAILGAIVAAVSRASTVCRARNSGGGLERKAADAALVKRLYSAIVPGSCFGFERSSEKLCSSDGTMAFAAGPAVERALAIAPEDAGHAASAVRTE